MPQSDLSLSIVAPCFNEAEVLPEFIRRASLAAQHAVGDAYEIVLVDDGSRDATWRIISDFALRDPHVASVRLMRNYGHQAAASAGLSLTAGERVLLIDADLQDPPELIASMMAAMDEGADVVFGQREMREGESVFKRASASLFYRLLGKVATIEIPRDTGDFRLMTRRVVDALTAMPERQRFIRGMVSWIGGKQVPLLYVRQSRFAGSSKYPLSKMIAFALDAITGFSTVPLRMATYLGFATALVAAGLLVFTIIRWAEGETVVGWSSVITAIVLFSGVQLVVLGVLGEYVGRLFQEVKRRPGFLVSEVVVKGACGELPVEFSDLSPRARRDIWDAVRNQERPPVLARRE